MPRFVTFLFAALVVVALLGANSPARAAEEAGLMRSSSSPPGGDPAKIRELRRLLRQTEAENAAARRARKASPRADGTEAAGPAATPGGDGRGPKASAERVGRAAADSPAAHSAHLREAGQPIAETAEEGEDALATAPAPPAARPGCMYRGETLIWERKPGTCHGSFRDGT